MKILKITLSILVFVTLQGCFSFENIELPLELEKPKAMNVYCQKDTNNLLRRIEYVYDNNNLVTEKSINDDKVYIETNY